MEPESLDIANGVLQKVNKGAGMLRNLEKSFQIDYRDTFVSPRIIREFKIPEGASILGTTKPGKRGRELDEIESICGLTPKKFKERALFKNLTPLDPVERFDLAVTGDLSMRFIDLMIPIGKGTRALIVSPPRTGKTMLLEQIAKSIKLSSPKTKIIVLLIDERPEEVTSFRRSVEATVLASSNDQSIQEHINLVEVTMGLIKTELECGKDIVVLTDSITRLGRAFNLKGSSHPTRTMSGGVDAGALEVPRRFFGLARNIENGGSATIIATALIDTGSRMDELIFQEFKGTGNCEIVLNRKLADQRCFPAIDLNSSGTRKEELLFTQENYRKITTIRKALAGRSTFEAADSLIKLMKKYPTNEELLAIIP